jgi:rhodanese-related sulfurtransferase
MKKFIFILLITLSTSSYANFVGINPTQLQEKINNKVAVIDIRTPQEWKELGIIPTSKKMMFFAPTGKYNIQEWLNQLSTVIKDQNTPLVLVCAHGNRTAIVGDFLSKKLKFKNIFHLEHGIISWLKEKRKTIK